MDRELLAKGVGASPGTATGAIAFRAQDVVSLVASGKSVIFVRIEMTPEDVPGMNAAAGLVATRGGLTGDAAIVARSLGKPCVTGCPPLRVDYANETMSVWKDSTEEESDIVLTKGDIVTIDGATGEIWKD